MILLSIGTNTVILTLNDSVTLSNPDFVLVFVEDQTNEVSACKLGTDLSTDQERYNQFTITVKSDPVALNAEVKLKDMFYRYFVYEVADAGDFDFDNINATDLTTLSGLIEQGKMKYVTTPTAHKYYKNRREPVKSYGD